MKTTKSKKIKPQQRIEKLLRWIGERAFLFFVVLVFFATIFGGIIFYEYSAALEKKSIELPGGVNKFDEAVYRQVLQAWQDRERVSIEAGYREYPNPFEGSLPTELTNQ